MERASAVGKAQWSALPSDTLITIFRRLNSSHLHLLCLRAVCSPWRSSLPLSLSTPTTLIVPSPNPPYALESPSPSGRYTVVQSTVLRLSPLSSPSSSSSSSWLVKVCLSKPNNTLSLLNPLTFSKIKLHDNVNINLLNFRISEVTSAYCLKFVANNEEQTIFVKKVVILTDMTVLLLKYGGTIERWRMGDASWTPIFGNMDQTKNSRYNFHDVICFHDECYAVSITGVLVKFDSGFIPVEITSSVGFSSREDKYLVPSYNGDDLFLVSKVSGPDPEFCYDYWEDMPVLNQQIFNMPIRVRVYKLNWNKGEWDFTRRLGDEVLFKGDDVSFSISARDFDGCRPNSIYLTDECFLQDGYEVEEEEESEYGQDTGLYALDERLIVGLAASPVHAKVFWPPPLWLVQGSTSSGCSM